MARYIDKDKLINEFKEDCATLVKERWFDDYVQGYNSAIEDIIAEPEAAVQEVRHGRWLSPQSKGCLSYDESAYKECSECGKVTFLAKTKNSQMNYCPNCGAKMDSEGERDGQRKTD